MEPKTSYGEAPAAATSLRSLPQDINGKLAMAMKLKDEGTEFFKAGKYKNAITSYAKVTAFTRGLPGSKRGLTAMSEMATSKTVTPIDADDENKATEIETAALTNIAMCYLKLKEPKKAVEFCQKALKTNPLAWKAVLRKSEAHAMMGNFELARSTATDALSMAPDAPSKSAILKEREKQNILERESNLASSAKQKKAFSKMFEKEPPPSEDA